MLLMGSRLIFLLNTKACLIVQKRGLMKECIGKDSMPKLLDVVGSSQIFIPTQNLERAYQVDKESKAVLRYFQYDQCAGPQKLSKLSFSKTLTKISGPKIQI